MTNREYAINLIVKEMSCNNKYLHTVLGLYRDNCSDKDKKGLNWCNPIFNNCGFRNCNNCFNGWLDEEYSTPMPTLGNGTFVGVQLSTYEPQIGVVVDDNIIYQKGTFDSIDVVKDNIIKVYNAKSFGGCLESNVVWSKL